MTQNTMKKLAVLVGATALAVGCAVGTVSPPARGLAERGAVNLADSGPPQTTSAGTAAPPGSDAPQGGVRILSPQPGALDIADAERVVAFGRGAFQKEAVALVEKLAEKLGVTNSVKSFGK